MPKTRSGEEMERTAQIVELLLEQWSIPSREFVERTAWVLRKDCRVSSFVPRLKALVVSLVSSSGGLTDTTTCSAMVPSFFRSLRELFVERRAILVSRLWSCEAPPGPAPGFPPWGMTTM